MCRLVLCQEDGKEAHDTRYFADRTRFNRMRRGRCSIGVDQDRHQLHLIKWRQPDFHCRRYTIHVAAKLCVAYRVETHRPIPLLDER